MRSTHLSVDGRADPGAAARPRSVQVACRAGRRWISRQRECHEQPPAATCRAGPEPWIDFIDRRLIDEGKLAELVANGIRGLTSNPTFFAKAVATGQYDGLVKRMLADGASTQQIHEEIAITTCADAADVLRPVFDEAPGAGDGHVSIEVEPGWANITEATIERVRHLCGAWSGPRCS